MYYHYYRAFENFQRQNKNKNFVEAFLHLHLCIACKTIFLKQKIQQQKTSSRVEKGNTVQEIYKTVSALQIVQSLYF